MLRTRGLLVLSVVVTIMGTVVVLSILVGGLENAHLSGVGAWVVVATTIFPCALLGCAFPMMVGVSRVVAESDGIEIHNWGVQRTRLRWQEISRFEAGSCWFAPAIAIAVRHDGSSVPMAGLVPLGPRSWSAPAGALALQPMIDYLAERLRVTRSNDIP